VHQLARISVLLKAAFVCARLVIQQAEVSYATLTAFCRRHGIGYAPPTPAGQYDFAPGE